jgi:hypothetical protein
MPASDRARSVAELLPRAFDDLDVDDVRQIVASVGEERESLFFERKRQVTPKSLAKICAAFANTYGGVLVAGIEDATDELVGVPLIGEPQVWVKDVLRPHVLPLPAFRARCLQLEGAPERCVLLVLVEESSTTPHLLTGAGAIYVRNPGSSDPVPINDQARLLELTRRGREARETAVVRANQAFVHTWNDHDLYTLVLASTGVASDVVRDLYRGRLPADGRSPIDLLVQTTELHDISAEARSRAHTAGAEWSLGRVRLARHVRRDFSQDPEALLDGLVVESDAVVQLQRCLEARDYDGDPEPRGPSTLWLNQQSSHGILSWFAEALGRGRELVTALEAHGDLYVLFGVRAFDRNIFWAESRAEKATRDFRVGYWASIAADPAHDVELVEQLRQDIVRDLGVQSPADS